MKDDKWIERWFVQSDSGSGVYTVGKDKDGNYACSCPGWTRHTPRTDCKHIQRAQTRIRGESERRPASPTWPQFEGVYTLEEYTIARMKGKV